MLVNALAYVANADVAKAVHGPHLKWSYPDCYFRPKKLAHIHPNLKYIPELREYEFISNKKCFKHGIQTNNDIVVFHRLIKKYKKTEVEQEENAGCIFSGYWGLVR